MKWLEQIRNSWNEMSGEPSDDIEEHITQDRTEYTYYLH